MEDWRQILDYPRYEVSNQGKVRTIKTGRIRKASPNRGGYYQVGLCTDEGMKTVSVHRCVAMAFIPRIEGMDVVDHINQNKQDNRVENLRWVNRSMNMLNRCDTRTDIDLSLGPAERRKVRVKKYRQSAVATKRYYCKTCDKAFQSKMELEQHFQSKKHISKVNIQ